MKSIVQNMNKINYRENTNLCLDLSEGVDSYMDPSYKGIIQYTFVHSAFEQYWQDHPGSVNFNYLQSVEKIIIKPNIAFSNPPYRLLGYTMFVRGAQYIK